MRTFRNKKGTNVKAYVKLSLYHIVVILFFQNESKPEYFENQQGRNNYQKKKEKLKIIGKWKLLINPSRITTLAYTSWISSSKSTEIPDLIFPNLRALGYLAIYLLIMYKKYFKHWSRQLKHT